MCITLEGTRQNNEKQKKQGGSVTEWSARRTRNPAVPGSKGSNGGHFFHVSSWRSDRHFKRSSEPREGLAACSAKGVPSFLIYFKTLSIGPAPGIESATSSSAVKRSTFVVKILWCEHSNENFSAAPNNGNIFFSECLFLATLISD